MDLQHEVSVVCTLWKSLWLVFLLNKCVWDAFCRLLTGELIAQSLSLELKFVWVMLLTSECESGETGGKVAVGDRGLGGKNIGDNKAKFRGEPSGDPLGEPLVDEPFGILRKSFVSTFSPIQK